MEPKNERTTAFEGGPYIPGAVPPPPTIDSAPAKPASNDFDVAFDGYVYDYTHHVTKDDLGTFKNIIEITPPGTDPVLYWHQVAMDAIRAQESAQKQAKQAREDLRRTERELQNLTSGLVARTADKRATIPIDMSRLIDMAKFGYIDLNVTISISKGKDVSDHG